MRFCVLRLEIFRHMSLTSNSRMLDMVSVRMPRKELRLKMPKRSVQFLFIFLTFF